MKQTKARDQEKPDAFKHKKSLGQNFLTSDVVPNWLCDSADLKRGETVLEIGPGTGRLTKVLLERGVRVIAVEADARAVASLEKTFGQALAKGSLTIHHGDSREITPETLGLRDQEFKVVANIPYYLSGILLRSLLESAIQPTTLVFLMQKELVHRITRDKKGSLLALGVRVFGEVSYVKTVTRGHFVPIPKVDSAILAVTNINRDNFIDLNPKFFFTILHLGLGKKRKQLLSNLTESWHRENLENIFTNLNLPLTVRGEDLPLETWLNLANQLKALPLED